MRSLSRRFGIAALSLALVATLIGSTQAGVIPWVYNVFFGPVGYGPAGYGAPAYGYGYPMAGGYGARSYGVAGYGCGPCRTPVQFSCRPSPCSPCSSGSCPTYVSYGPSSSCKAGQEVTGWKSDETQTFKTSDIDRRTPRPVDAAPAPTTTFADESSAVTESTEPSELESEAAKPATSAIEAAPGNINEPAVSVKTSAPAGGLTTTETKDNPGFVSSSKAATETPDATPGAAAPPGPTFEPPRPPAANPDEDEKETGTPAPKLPVELLNPAGVDDETSWKLTVPSHRLARRVNYRNAQIARRSVVVNSEYVIPSESVAHIVTRD